MKNQVNYSWQVFLGFLLSYGVFLEYSPKSLFSSLPGTQIFLSIAFVVFISVTFINSLK